MNEVNQPAARQPAAILGELKCKAKSLVGAMAREDELNLQRAAELGRTLDGIRDRCKDGEWGRTLEELAITSQRASEYRRIAKLGKGELSMCGSIRAAVEYINALEPNDVHPGGESPGAGESPPGASGIPEPNGAPVEWESSGAGQFPPAASGIKPKPGGATAPGPDLTPHEPEIKCPSCERKGWRPGCLDCKALAGVHYAPRKSAPEIMGAQPTDEHEGREPGEDDGSLDVVAASVPFDDGKMPTKGKVALAFSPVFQEIDALAKMKKAWKSDTIKTLRRQTAELQSAVIDAHKTL